MESEGTNEWMDEEEGSEVLSQVQSLGAFLGH